MSLSIIKSNLCLNSSVWKLGDSKQHFLTFTQKILIKISIKHVRKGHEKERTILSHIIVSRRD